MIDQTNLPKTLTPDYERDERIVKISGLVAKLFDEEFGHEFGEPISVRSILKFPGPHGSGFIEIGGSLSFLINFSELPPKKASS